MMKDDIFEKYSACWPNISENVIIKMLFDHGIQRSFLKRNQI